MSLSNGHSTIYCVYDISKPQYIVSTFPGQRTGHGQRTADRGRRGQLQAGAEGAQRGRSFRPWPCQGRAEEKPLDSAWAVTGAQGRGSIIVVGIIPVVRHVGIIGIKPRLFSLGTFPALCCFILAQLGQDSVKDIPIT